MEENRELLAKAVAGLQSAFPRDFGGSFVESESQPKQDNANLVKKLIVVSENLQNWRMVQETKVMSRNGRQFHNVTEHLLRENLAVGATLKTEVSKDTDPVDAGTEQFRPNAFVLSNQFWPVTNSPDLFGGTSLFLGFLPTYQGLLDLHSDEIAEQLSVKKIDKDHFELKIKGSETTVSFKLEHGQAVPREIRTHAVYTNETGKFPAPWRISILRRNEKGEVDLLGEVYEEEHEVETLLTLRRPKFESDEVDALCRIAVKNGTPLGVGGERPGQLFHYFDGMPTVVIDEDAERIIHSLLPREPTISQPKFKRIPYLRSTSNAAHCGVYSFAAVAAKHGVEVPLGELLTSGFVSQSDGSTAADLVSAAEKYGLYADVVRNADISFLKNIELPCILHFANSYQTEQSKHWVSLLEVSNDDTATVVDLPRSPEQMPLADLLTYWDGTAVIVSKKPIDRSQLLLSRTHHFIPIVISIVALCLLYLVARRFNLKTAHEAALIFCISAAMAVAWACSTENGFLRNLERLGVVIGKVPSVAPLPEVFNVDVFEQSGVAIVDARLPNAFHRNHIQGAVNIPVDCSLGELRSGLDNLAGSSSVIVYCETDKCRWGLALGNRLKAIGVPNIKVFTPGFAGYTRQMGKDNG